MAPVWIFQQILFFNETVGFIFYTACIEICCNGKPTLGSISLIFFGQSFQNLAAVQWSIDYCKVCIYASIFFSCNTISVLQWWVSWIEFIVQKLKGKSLNCEFRRQQKHTLIICCFADIKPQLHDPIKGGSPFCPGVWLTVNAMQLNQSGEFKSFLLDFTRSNNLWLN